MARNFQPGDVTVTRYDRMYSTEISLAPVLTCAGYMWPVICLTFSLMLAVAWDMIASSLPVLVTLTQKETIAVLAQLLFWRYPYFYLQVYFVFFFVICSFHFTLYYNDSSSLLSYGLKYIFLATGSYVRQIKIHW